VLLFERRRLKAESRVEPAPSGAPESQQLGWPWLAEVLQSVGRRQKIRRVIAKGIAQISVS
jgi:hypothetical protein